MDCYESTTDYLIKNMQKDEYFYILNKKFWNKWQDQTYEKSEQFHKCI